MGGEERWLIVERPNDPSGQTYTQCFRLDEARYHVEQRDGVPAGSGTSVPPADRGTSGRALVRLA